MIIVYLLCDPAHATRCSHYIGSTTPSQFKRRMRAHVDGVGCKTTAKMIAGGAMLQIGRLWTASDRSLEQRLKHNGHYEKLCRRCRGELPFDLPILPPKRVRAPFAQAPWSPITL